MLIYTKKKVKPREKGPKSALLSRPRCDIIASKETKIQQNYPIGKEIL